MSGRISDYQAEEWLDTLRNSWMALHYDNPDVAGAYASEVFGGGYTRQQVNFSAPDARAIWNSAAVVFAGLPPVVITHVAIWDAQTAGNYLASVALVPAHRVIAGRKLTISPQTIAISLD